MLVLLQNIAVMQQANVSGSGMHVGAVRPRTASKLKEVGVHECACAACFVMSGCIHMYCPGCSHMSHMSIHAAL